MEEFFLNYAQWIWLGVLILCIVIEAMTQFLTTIWAGIASFLMIFLALTKLDFKWQLLVFCVITILLIIFTRPFALKHLKMGKYSTNINSLEGQEVLVIKKISKFEKGQVKAKNGVIWNATSDDENEIEVNSVCKIKSVDGNTLIVG